MQEVGKATAVLKNGLSLVPTLIQLIRSTNPMTLHVYSEDRPPGGLTTASPWNLEMALSSLPGDEFIASLHKQVSFIPGFSTTVTMGQGTLDTGILRATVDFLSPPLPPSNIAVVRDANGYPILTWKVERELDYWAVFPKFDVYRAPAGRPELRKLVYTTNVSADSYGDYWATLGEGYLYWVQAVAGGVTSTMPDPVELVP